MTAFWAVLTRDLKLGLRHAADLAMVVIFFVLAAVLFPFGVGPEANDTYPSEARDSARRTCRSSISGVKGLGSNAIDAVPTP